MGADAFAEWFQRHIGAYIVFGEEGARPETELLGFRGGERVIGVTLREGTFDQRQLVTQFTLATMLLKACNVEDACLLTGDAMGAMLLDERDVPGPTFAAGLMAGTFEGGLVVPYTFDPATKAIDWGQARRLDHSLSSGLWAEAIAPGCFEGPLTTLDIPWLVEANDAAGNHVWGDEGGVTITPL